MAYGSNKDLLERIESDKNLREKAFKSASDSRYGSFKED